MSIAVGDQAPEFTLPSTGGTDVSLGGLIAGNSRSGASPCATASVLNPATTTNAAAHTNQRSIADVPCFLKTCIPLDAC